MQNNKAKSENFTGSSRSPSPRPGPSRAPGLHSLADGEAGERPPYSNFTLVKYAILGSPKQKLTLSEIYLAISARFPWFQTAGKGWKNSVRHCLSLDTQFQKVPRPVTEHGKGCYWTVALATPRGNKRERKRNKRPTKRLIAADFAGPRSNPPSTFPLTTPAFGDYAATIPAQPTTEAPLMRPLAQPPVQSGWTPYFPTAAVMSAPLSIANYTQVSGEDPRPPNLSPPATCDLSPTTLWHERDDGSDGENDTPEPC